jgi:hypothetical protein
MQHEEKAEQHQGAQPSDTETLVGDTAASNKLTEAKRVQPPEVESRGSTPLSRAAAEVNAVAPRHEGSSETT